MWGVCSPLPAHWILFYHCVVIFVGDLKKIFRSASVLCGEDDGVFPPARPLDIVPRLLTLFNLDRLHQAPLTCRHK